MKTVLNGINRYDFSSIKKYNVGVIVNYSSVTKNLDHILDELLKLGVKVRYIFTPRHGLYGAANGEKLKGSVHSVYKIPITSLYGERFSVERAILEELDILIYDIQDVGLKYYTFIHTLTKTLE